MVDVTGFNDDDVGMGSCSQRQRDLSEAQKSRMLQHKELALARLQARKLQQAQVPPPSGIYTILPQHASPHLLHRNPDSGRLSSQECSNYSTSPGPQFQNGEKFLAEGRGTQQIPCSFNSNESLRHTSTEKVGDWISVRKRPAPGSSFGRQITDSSNQFKPSSESEIYPIFKSHKTSPNASRFSQQSPGNSQSNVKRFHWQQQEPPVRILKPDKSQNASPTTLPKGKVVPSKEQMEVLKAIAQQKSVFITGSAGTGKSFIIEDGLRVLRGMYGEDAVFVTASTGLAACALGGITLHSFAGVGIGADTETKEQLLTKVRKRRDVRARWTKARALVIDEISMIDGELFDNLEYIASNIKGRSEPWGGLQLIVTGDFFQLEPVKPSNPLKYFAFQAECWNRSFDIQVELTHVFRQSDMEFVNMLNEIRRGVCSPSTLHRLRQCQGPPDRAFNGIEMTKLYPHQMDVHRENDQNLRCLGGDMITYRAKDDASTSFGQRQLDNVRAAAIQPLCLGAQVMLLKNLETAAGLVNGSRGVVVRFSAPDDPASEEYAHLAKFINPTNQWPIVRFACDGLERLVGPVSWSVSDGNKEIAKRIQIPLMLAWALSVHKCQGMTLDHVETDLCKAFGHGMVYVALSRVKSLQGLRLIGFDPSRILARPVVSQFYEGLNKKLVVDLDDDEFT